MKNSDEILRFNKEISENEDFRKKLDETIKRIYEEGKAESDFEALVKAAGELGFDLDLGEIERAQAECQHLSAEEMESISGGEDKWCMLDWYCFGVMMHEDAEYEKGRTSRACWSDYECIIGYHTPPFD